MKHSITKLACIFLILVVPCKSSAQFEVCNSNTLNTLYDICFINENTGIAVGDSGIILRSEDGGLNWNTIHTNTTMKFTKVKFFDDNHGITIGTNIFTTMDAGVTWHEEELDNARFDDVEIVNDSCAILSGSPNQIYKSCDFGSDWDTISDTSIYSISQMSFIDENIGYAIHWEGSETSSTLKTINGGRDWEKITDETGADIVLLEDIVFINEETGFRGGWYDAHLMKTDDGAIHWDQTSNTDTTNTWSYWSSIYDFHIEESLSSSYYACGWYGEIFKSLDRGDSWHELETSLPTHTSLYGIYFIDESRGWAVGDSGTIIRTSNGGGLTKTVEIPEVPNIQLTPNPFDQELYINNQGDSKIERITFFDESGRIVWNTNQTKIVQTQDLVSGIYFVVVKTNKGYITDRLIKK